ncbi:MAG TPA: acyl carrier protein [Gammaproteobacteria bacterium]|nr:acyl carrier protein [Gammaproteobacteria bacterium]
MHQEVESEVLNILQEATKTKISLDQPLLDSGLVDSIAAVDIALAVESALGVTIPATEIGEQLKTARTLIEYVSSHR